MAVNEQNYVDEAEKVILALKNRRDMKGRPIPMVTTSKLRNLLSISVDIYNEIMNSKEEKLSEEICSRIEYLRVRFLYEAGRDNSVRNLVTEAKLVDQIKFIQGSRKRYVLFYRYMEALVAFHRYYGGKEM